jgi:hypothetical protein
MPTAGHEPWQIESCSLSSGRGMKVVGLMPMAGMGVRLGMPFPKLLAPIIVGDGVVAPLYYHALGHLRVVANPIYAVISSQVDPSLPRSLEAAGVETIPKHTPGEICSSFAHGARHIIQGHGRDTLIAVVLPDSIWKLDPSRSMQDVVEAVRGDGALALFSSRADELDIVVTDGPRVQSVTTKVEGATGTIQGWGGFVIRAPALARFTDAEKDGPQLGRLDMGWSHIGQYHDLGTPERYIAWHDLRER